MARTCLRCGVTVITAHCGNGCDDLAWKPINWRRRKKLWKTRILRKHMRWRNASNKGIRTFCLCNGLPSPRWNTIRFYMAARNAHAMGHIRRTT